MRVEVFATGFVNPRGIAFRSDGSMFVAEAGFGGEQAVEVGWAEPLLIGRTGQITRISPGGTRYSMVYGIPSVVTAGGEEVGPSALAFIDDTLYVLTASGDWEIGDSAYNSGIFRLTPDGRLDEVFDYTEYVKAGPALARHEGPRADVPAGMLYGLAALDDRLYIADGNQEHVVEVDPATGAGRLIAEYAAPNVARTGSPAGPDGTLYVAEFATNKVTRIGLDGTVTDAATNLRAPIAVAFDPTGALYVLEHTGRLLRTASAGQEQTDVLIEGLNEPTAMAFAPDGNLHVAVNGRTAAHGEGMILRVKLAPDPPGHELRHLPVILSWGIGLSVFAVFMVMGWRNRRRESTATY
ncbi:MAG: ScyD/ScyE family protein [Chloroflexota bacterium]|nr:ScyD/ScyE family protein [Chloroflexota bacterium]